MTGEHGAIDGFCAEAPVAEKFDRGIDAANPEALATVGLKTLSDDEFGACATDVDN